MRWSFLLVEPRGIEPLSENRSTELSTSVFGLKDLPPRRPTDKIRGRQPFYPRLL